MASRFFFNGFLHTSPVVVSMVDDRLMAPQNAAVGNNIAVVGEADGGRPDKAMVHSTPKEAERDLIGGELVVGVRKAFSPSAATGGPMKVYSVRVGKPTQSTLTLKDSAAADSIVLTSEVYGIHANQIRVQIEAGTLSGKRATVRMGNTYYTANNLGRAALSVRYTGADQEATVEVNNTQLVLKSGPTGSLVTRLTVLFASQPTVQQVVDQINTIAGFTASVSPGATKLKTQNGLDGISPAVDCKTAAVTVRADLAALIAWFNSHAERLVSAERATGATKVPANVSYTFLSGATYPAVVLQDWLDAIDALVSQDVQHIVPLSPDPAVHLATDAHCTFMSLAGRKERRCYVGPDVSTTFEQVLELPKALSSDRAALVWPGHWDTDLTTGERVLLPPYMTAVHIAAGFAGMNPGEAMTNKSIRVQGLEYDPSFPAETDQLIDAGVCAIEDTPRGYKCVRSISTWRDNDNFNRVEISCGIATDFMIRAVREALQPLIGKKGNPQLLDNAVQTTESVLKSLAKPEPAGPGVIVGDADSPAYRNIVATLQGDVLSVEFQASPVIPVNFIPVAVSVVPYTGIRRAATFTS